MQAREREHKSFSGRWFGSFYGVASLMGVWLNTFSFL